jgi:muramidase (phage lysozyme)
MNDPIELIEALEHPNVQAFIHMLRFGEGTQGDDGFRIVFGGRKFVGKDGIIGTLDDFADHPRGSVTATLGGKPITSTAAGAGQFLSRTWDGVAKQYGLLDFSPKNQLLAIVALIKGRRALEDVIAGRFEQAVMKCNKEWASLPGSPYGQPVVTMAEARAQYEAGGGTYAEEGAAAPRAAAPAPAGTGIPPNPFTQQEADMPHPFLFPAITALIDLVPKLGGLFSSGSPTSTRNIKAAEIVVNAAKDAIGAANEQELVESIARDPAAAAAARDAIEKAWFQITEVGGGIQAAREAAVKYQAPDSKSFIHNPAFWISILLVAMPFMLLVDVFYVHPDSYQSELRTQIVTGVLMVISMVGAFWLGSSMGSQKKNDILTR